MPWWGWALLAVGPPVLVWSAAHGAVALLEWLDRKLADAWDVEEDIVSFEAHFKIDKNGNVISAPGAMSAQSTLASDFRNKLYARIKDIDVKVDCPHADCVYGPHHPRPEWLSEDTLSSHHGPVHEVVIHLNDTHRVSREDIANWLDSLDLDLEVHQDPVRKGLGGEVQEKLDKYLEPTSFYPEVNDQGTPLINPEYLKVLGEQWMKSAQAPKPLTDKEMADIKAAISEHKALYSEQLNQLFYDPTKKEN